MRKSTVLCAALLAAAAYANAGQTRVWSVGDREEFEKGTIQRLSLSSDGKLALAPLLKEIFDSSSPYLWAVARDSKGNLYAGGGGAGGSKTKLYVVPNGGTGKPLAELDGMDIYALAIDKQDRVYAATSPDGKVYRVAADGKAEVFYNPGAKYIWAMAFASAGDLYVATGDQGEIHRVTPTGKGAVFFKTDETHARSLAIDAHGNLIVGTEPGGSDPARNARGRGLRALSGRQARGDGRRRRPGRRHVRRRGRRSHDRSSAHDRACASARGNARRARDARAPAAPPPTFAPGAASLSGGSEVYRIETDGFPRKLWSHPQEIVYALAIDRAGRAIAGTGNKGNIYRLDSELLSTLLLNTAPTQITSLVSGPAGELYAASGNVGRVFAIGPGLEKDGTIESEAFDAKLHSLWGRLECKAALNGGRIAIATRSGNLDRPRRTGARGPNPSPRSTAGASVRPRPASSNGAPPSNRLPTLIRRSSIRFRSPTFPRTLRPLSRRSRSLRPNYKFPPQSLTLTPSQSLTLPPLPRRNRPATPQFSISSGSSSATLQFAKGFLGARWAARDENGDDLDLEARNPRRFRNGVETPQREDQRQAPHLGFHRLPRRRIPRARHGLRFTGQSRRPVAHRATCKRQLHHRQHAARNLGAGRGIRRGLSQRALDRPRRAQRHRASRVFARRW